MASCHAITYVNDELIGDPLEIEMFNTTGWVLDESVKLSNSELESDVVVLAYVRPQNASNGLEFASYEEGHSSQDVAIVRRFDFEWIGVRRGTRCGRASRARRRTGA